MHNSSFQNMARFVQNYLLKMVDQPLNILDVGSQDIYGSYKPLFNNPSWKYMGLDITPGDNVDIVVHDAYNWKDIPSRSMDVVVSGQALEHIEYIWITIIEMARVLKTGGLLCIIVPSSGPEHKYPLDCWRFYPDGLKALAKYSTLETIDAFFANQKYTDIDQDEQWNDCILIAKKIKLPLSMRIKVGMRNIFFNNF